MATTNPDPQQAQASPAASAPASPSQVPPPAEPPNPRGRSKAIIIVVLVGVILGVGGVIFWNYAQTYESTDDAVVDGHLNNIAARIQGAVTAVYADQNQFVQAGQTLVDIDARDYQVTLAEAKAQLAQSQADIQAQTPNVPITQTTSESNISSSQSDVTGAAAAVASAESDAAAAASREQEARAQLRLAEANAGKAQADLERYQGLAAKDEIPRTQFDAISADAKAKSAAVDSARAAIVSAQATTQAAARTVEQKRAQLAAATTQQAQASRNAPQQVAISRATLMSKQAMANVASARVDRARLDLDYTKIMAPVSGIISRRSVETGAIVQPGQQLFTIAQVDGLWITANFKETQLRRMRAGLRVSIGIDALDQTFNGTVESMPAATGAVSSLLPPENATGNFVKVVQRLPVRIKFEPNQNGLNRLRPGMSATPKVWL